MTILNTYMIKNPTFIGPAMWVPIVAAFILGFWLVYSDTKEIILGILLGFLFSLIGALGGGLLSMGFGPFIEIPRYEVTFDDTISIVEVMEDYNIIEQRGQIFVLEDKEIGE